GVIVVTGHDVGGATHHGGQCLAAALEIDRFLVQSGLREKAELLGQCQGQIGDEALAADGDGDLGFVGRLCRADGQHQQQYQGQTQGLCYFHDELLVSLRVCCIGTGGGAPFEQ